MVGLLQRRPTRMNGRLAQTAIGASIPPPIGGLNRRDALANMDPRDALTLDNIFPQPSFVNLRGGYSSWATGMSGTIKTLMEWSGPAAVKKLKSANAGNIYDITTAGAVGAAEITGQTSDDWQWVNFTTSGGQFLLMVNGSDAPQNYNGTAWSTSPAITGVTPANLISIAAHKQRLWFVEKNSMNAWYLPVQTIGGAAVQFPLGALFKLGGKLQAIGTVSSDAGDGVDDFICFISSRGEVAMYQGTDPSSSSTWSIVGVFRVGFPIGNRCTVDVAGDLGIITADGIVSMKQMMRLDRASSQRAAITNKIQNLFNQYVRSYSTLAGWQPLVYPRGNAAYFNVPFSSTQFVQLVMNTITGAWCRFTNMNAYCWGLFGDDIYFGGTGGIVYKADTGFQDGGGVISAQLKTAWNYFGRPGQNKFFTQARPLIQTNGTPSIQFAFNTNFEDVPPTGTISAVAPGNSAWGSATWGAGLWGGDTTLTDQWVTPQGVGYCGAANIIVTSQNSSFILNSIDVQYMPGGPL